MQWSVVLLHKVFDMFGDWFVSSSPPLPPPLFLAMPPPLAMHKEISLQADLHAQTHDMRRGGGGGGVVRV